MFSYKLRNWIIALLAAVCVLALVFAAVSYFVFSNTENALADATGISGFTPVYGDDDETVEYYTLASGDYALSADIALDHILEIPAGETVSLDMAGHHISVDANSTADSYSGESSSSTLPLIYIKGNLTVKDSGYNADAEDSYSISIGDTAVTWAKNKICIFWAAADGVLTVDSGSYYLQDTGAGSAISIKDSGTVIINGGAISGKSHVVISSGNIIMNAGTISNSSDGNVIDSTGGSVCIYGGEINSPQGTAIYVKNGSDSSMNIAIGDVGNDKNSPSITAYDTGITAIGSFDLNIYSGTITATQDGSTGLDIELGSGSDSVNANISDVDITAGEIALALLYDFDHVDSLSSYDMHASISDTTISATGSEGMGVAIMCPGTYEFTDCTIEGGCFGFYVMAPEDETDVEEASPVIINMSGCSVTGMYGFYSEGFVSDSLYSLQFTVNGGTIKGNSGDDDDDGMAVYICCVGKYNFTDVTIHGDLYGVYVYNEEYEDDDESEAAAEDTEITISGCTITSSEDYCAGVVVRTPATCVIADSDISGDIGVIVRAGSVSIQGGTISGAYEGQFEFEYGAGSGAGLVMANYGKDALDVTISGGTISGYYGIALLGEYSGSSSSITGTLTVTGGTIGVFDDENDTDTAITPVGDNDPYITVSLEGGYYYGKIVPYIDEEVEPFITEGVFVSKYNSLDSDYIILSANTRVKVEKETRSVSGEEIDYYTVTVALVHYITLPAQSKSSFTYGDADIPESFGQEFITDGEMYYSVVLASGTDAGTYTVSVVADEYAYFVDEDGNVLTVTTLEFTYTISKASNAVTLVKNEDGTFTATASFGEAVVKIYSDADCTQEITGDITSSGTYYARAEVEGTENYDGAVSEVVSFTASVAETDVLAVISIAILCAGLVVSLVMIIVSGIKGRKEDSEATK